MDNKHRGGDFDEFLREEGIYEEVCDVAAKRLVTQQVDVPQKVHDLLNVHFWDLI